jgi:hypothetical protein
MIETDNDWDDIDEYDIIILVTPLHTEVRFLVMAEW